MLERESMGSGVFERNLFYTRLRGLSRQGDAESAVNVLAMAWDLGIRAEHFKGIVKI
jgi:hypothetical protein